METEQLALNLGQDIELPLVHIPSGEFLMGSDRKTDRSSGKDERPQHRVYLDEYWIGKHPVTNAQYRRFLSETGYTPPQHWLDDLPDEEENNYPVTNIVYSDIRAFCYWLSFKADEYICIPTEAEWEKAARGTNGCIWTWGNDKPNRRNFKAKSYENGYKQPIGLYCPTTDSPYGCVDMVTNVGEICNTLRFKGPLKPFKYPYSLTDGREHHQSPQNRSVRGGALSHGVDLKRMRCAARNWTDPNTPIKSLGFRIILTRLQSRWQIAFPDEGEKQELTLRLRLGESMADSSELKDVKGYDILGIKKNWSGVFIRSDRFDDVDMLIKKLKQDFPKLNASKTSNFQNDLPGSSVLRLSKLSGKDQAVWEWMVKELMIEGWDKADPAIARKLSLKQQFGMEHVHEPEKEWLWLAKPKY